MSKPLTASKIKKKLSRLLRSKADKSVDRQGKPYTSQGDVSFSNRQQPPLDRLSQTARSSQVTNVLDEELKTHSGSSPFLKRFSQTIQLHAGNVPKDGNCLLHAVSMAVSSVDDSRNTLRDLMLASVRNDLNLRTRWWGQQMGKFQSADKSLPMIIDKSWDDIVDNISQHSAGTSLDDVPCRFSDSFYIYALANIVHRPIIVVEETMVKSVAGNDPQSCDIGGLYLPLELEPTECCKTPVIIGYSFNHFYPLHPEACPESDSSKPGTEDSQLFPLVNIDFSLMRVRYLIGQEVSAAWDLVKSYLVVKELNVPGDLGTFSTIPCAQLKPLTPKHNLLCEHLYPLKELRDLDASHRHLRPPTSLVAKHNNLPHSDTKVSNQKKVASARFAHGLPGQLVNPAANGKSEIPFLEIINENNQKRVPDAITQKNSPNNDVIKSAQTYSGGCGHYNLTSETTLNNTYNSAVPTAPFPSLEPQSRDLMISMMVDRCRNGCGYRCSTQTYPFCHECYPKEMQRNNPEGLCLLQTVKVPAAEGHDIINVVSETSIQSNENHALTPTAPPPSIGPPSLEQMMAPLIDPRNEYYKECPNQEDTFSYECHKTEAQKNTKLGQNNQTWPEKEKHFDSCMDIPSDDKSAWMSIYGSYIQQASEEYKYTEHSGVSKVGIDCALWDLKWSPKSFLHKISETSKPGVPASLSNTSSGEIDLCKDLNQLNTFLNNESKAFAHTKYSNASIEIEISASNAKATPRHGITATHQIHRQPLNSSNSSSFISTDTTTHLSGWTTSSSTDLQSSVYSGSAQPFLPLESSSWPSSSQVYQSLGDPELKFTIVTNVTRYSESTYTLPTDYTNTFYQKPTDQWPGTKEETENRRTSGAKCRLASCSNYGNKDNAGFCNACHKVIRRQRILEWEAKQGINVPDCCMGS